MFDYDVAISFAGEQRKEAEAIAYCLKKNEVKVFYDGYEKADLWGKDLYEHLSTVYQKKARYCLMLVSAAYAAKVWPTHERRNAQARALSQNTEYILPVRFDGMMIGDFQSGETSRLSPGTALRHPINLALQQDVVTICGVGYPVVQGVIFDTEPERRIVNDNRKGNSTHYRRNERYRPGGSE